MAVQIRQSAKHNSFQSGAGGVDAAGVIDDTLLSVPAAEGVCEKVKGELCNERVYSSSSCGRG